MIGQQIQNYTITAYLGEGGMGTVYRASDTMLGRDVALKMLHTTLISQPQFFERFKKEARVLAQLLHPNIAVIYNFIGQESQHFMVMEYVEGTNLDTLLKKHRVLPYMLVVPFFLQVLEGLGHAHKKGIFHRDIKPANLMVTPDGTVKLMDFGIAKMAGEQRLTQVNRVVGTIEYMAPELIEGKDPSIASDIYAAGVTMYELLTGQLPFENATDYTLMQEIMKKKPVSVDKLNAAVPASISAIVMKALEKKPEHRYADAKSFQQALSAACPGLREVDLRILQQAALPVTEVIAQPKKKTKVRQAHAEPSVLLQKSKEQLSTFRKKWLTRQKAPVLIGIGSLLLAFIIVIAMPGKPEDLSQENKLLASVSAETEYNVKKETKEHAITNSDSVSSTLALPAADLPQRKKDTGFEILEEKKEEVKKLPTTKEAIKKPVSKNTLIEEPVKEQPAPVVVSVKKEEPIAIPEEPVKKNPQSIRLNTRVEVNLQLLNVISESGAKEGQLLQFNVTKPVTYNGETIIPAGSRATGIIKNLTRKKISIVLNSVSSISGQSLPFETTELSGRIEEIISSKYYSGMLRKGTIITF
jgi:serine/threonine protein kinase